MLRPGDTATIKYKIRRLVPEPTRIVGFNRFCACIEVLDLPMDLTDSGDQLTVQVRAQPSAGDGLVSYDVPLLLNIDARQSHIPVAFYVKK